MTPFGNDGVIVILRCSRRCIVVARVRLLPATETGHGPTRLRRGALAHRVCGKPASEDEDEA